MKLPEEIKNKIIEARAAMERHHELRDEVEAWVKLNDVSNKDFNVIDDLLSSNKDEVEPALVKLGSM